MHSLSYQIGTMCHVLKCPKKHRVELVKDLVNIVITDFCDYICSLCICIYHLQINRLLSYILKQTQYAHAVLCHNVVSRKCVENCLL